MASQVSGSLNGIGAGGESFERYLSGGISDDRVVPDSVPEKHAG